MKYKKLLRVAAFFLPFSIFPVSCTTYDYDEELNDAEQQRLRLHEEDLKIYDEITEASQSLDYLIGEMSARVRGELGEKETALIQAISDGEALVRQYLDEKIGDADEYVDDYDRRMRQLMEQKEGDFNQSCELLQQQMTELADQGYNENVQKMQEGIDLLNNFHSMYDEAVGKMNDRIAGLSNMGTRLSALEQQLLANQNKRDQILQRIDQLKQKMENIIQTGVTSTKTSEEHTAALQELQTAYSEIVTSMKFLNDTYDYDDSWVNEAETCAQAVQAAIGEMEDAIQKANELNALLDQYEPDVTDAMLSDLEDIRDKMETLANYDTSTLDEAQDAANQLQGICDEIFASVSRCEDAILRCEDAQSDADWTNY